jgi:succinate dehydrogenase/fumarate reductase cytochrome b subunit
VLLPVAKFLVAFPFCYHSAGTIRHLVWDKTAKGLDLKSVHASSYAVAAVGVAGAVVLALAEFDE